MTISGDKTATETNEEARSGLDDAPRPYLFVVCECARPDVPPTCHSLDGIDHIRFGRGEKRAVSRRWEGDTCLLDVFMPDRWMSSEHAHLVRAGDSWLFEDASSKNGSFVNGVHKKRTQLQDGDLLELGRTFFTFRFLSVGKLENDDMPREPEFTTIIPHLRRQFALLARMAPGTGAILLTGETGTGKEMLARAAHRLSQRTGEFLGINCAALTSTMVEAELFGAKKGSFTGADHDRDGLIRAAQGGTLFLDEIGELPLAAQGALLRVLQEREVIPIGSTRPVRVDFRLISATNRDLDALVAKESFRADLLARIRGFEMQVPPLRERREDLPLLIAALIARQGPRGKQLALTSRVMQTLLLYEWPANIRELEKSLETAVALTQESSIDLEDLPQSVSRGAVRAREGAVDRAQGVVATPELDLGLKPHEIRRREELIGLLRIHNGNVAKVARSMKKGRNQIVRWLKRYNLDADKFRHQT